MEESGSALETPPTVLLVDDDEDALQLLLRMVERLGYRGITARDGASAVKAANDRSRDLDAIVLDLMMPGDLDGYGACKRLRDDPSTRSVPVIILSARASAADMAASYAAGAFQHFGKPYDIQHLSAVIERMVRLRRRERAAVEHGMKFRAIFDSSPLEMALVDAELRLREMNAAFAGHFPAAKPGDAFFTTAYDAAPPDADLYPLVRALRGGTEQDDILEATRGGKIVWHRVIAAPLRDEDGGVRSAVVSIEDVSAQRELQSSLERQVDRNKKALQWQDELAVRLMGYQKELRQKNGELESAKKELERLSVTDPLTRLYNRRQFDEALRQETRRCARYNHSLSLLMLDIDYFKKVNDTYLHESGDIVLRDTAEIFRKTLRETDTIIRYGGEEFTAVLPETSVEVAAVIGERLRAAVEAAEFTITGGRTIRITISIGIAAATGKEISPADLIRRADAALYRAKEGGRNQVVIDGK